MKFNNLVLRFKASRLARQAKHLAAKERGSSLVEVIIIIIIVIVLAALILAFLYSLFGNTLLPTISQKLQDMFNYAG